MNKEEKLKKIIEMTSELLKLQIDEFTDKEVDQLFLQTKFSLEAIKELKKINNKEE